MRNKAQHSSRIWTSYNMIFLIPLQVIYMSTLISLQPFLIKNKWRWILLI